MPMKPEEIERRDFSSSLRGYDKTEVRDFLRRVAHEVGRMQEDLVNSAEAPDPAFVAPGAMVDSTPSFEPGDSYVAQRTDDEPTAAAVEVPAALSGLPVQGAEEPEVVPATTMPAGDLDTDDDRFEELGERIAGLLRSAHESAAQLKEKAEDEASTTIQTAREAAEQIRTTAADDAAAVREEAQRDGEEARNVAVADADRIVEEAENDAAAMRDEANRLETAARELLAQAEVDAAALKEKAIYDGTHELDGRRAEIESQEAASQADREAAMAELADARSQVSSLLHEARAQSDFIKHEAEDIIRTKIRANIEQAEQRLGVLRNSEVASRERIAAARNELAGALERLDADLAPELPSNAEQLAIDEAHERGAAVDYGMLPAAGVVADDVTEVETSEVAHADVIETEADVVDAVEADTVEAEGADGFEADAVETVEADAVEAEGVEVDTVEADTVETDTVEAEGVEVDALEAEAVEADTAEVDASEVAEVADDSDAVDTDSDESADVADGYSDATVEDAPAATVAPFDGGFAHNDLTTVEHLRAIEPNMIETPIVEVPEVNEVVEAVAEAPETPAYEPAPPVQEQAPATMAEALGVSADATTFDPLVDDSIENEDALARLVRQAMQRAVDNARTNVES